jgi:hypothetical protein
MEGLIPIAVWAVIILIGLGLVGIVLFGARNILYGKISPITIGVVVIPAILLVVLGFAFGDWSLAAIWTLLIMFGLAAIALLISGVRGLFNV